MCNTQIHYVGEVQSYFFCVCVLHRTETTLLWKLVGPILCYGALIPSHDVLVSI